MAQCTKNGQFTVNKNGSKTGHFECVTKSVYSSKIDVGHKKMILQPPKCRF